METSLPKSVLSFIVSKFENDPGTATIVPAIDDAPLTELIARYERDHQLEPCGGYGGLVPNYFDYQSFDRYFFGDFDPDSNFAGLGGIYVLGCECGEVGCWPLRCRVQREGDSIAWDRFQQPHRPDRDYSSFGPFFFASPQYRRAIVKSSFAFSA